jgi:hypothetical protein
MRAEDEWHEIDLRNLEEITKELEKGERTAYSFRRPGSKTAQLR